MKFLKKLKSSNFWVSMISAVILILQAVFNVDIKTEYLNQIILGILGILVMTGIVSDTPNNEVAVKQEFDFDKLKDTIALMFTQINDTLKTDITKVMSQLNNSTQDVSTKHVEEDVVRSNSTPEKAVEENKTEQQVVEPIVVVDKIEEKQTVVPEIQVQQIIVQDNAPKNEL